MSSSSEEESPLQRLSNIESVKALAAKHKTKAEEKDLIKEAKKEELKQNADAISFDGENEDEAIKQIVEETTFLKLGVCAEIAQACTNLGYKNPTKIQSESLPYTLKGRDIIGLAETGSGKTAAFAIPVIQALLDNPQPFFACVMSPTRELCIQIAEQFEALGSLIGLRCAVLVGGLDMVS